MKTLQNGHPTRPILSQTQNNATLWIGHLPADTNDHLAGQTFDCPSGGSLDNIQVFSASVQQPGELTLTLHKFDRESRTWGPAIAHAGRTLEKGDESRWIRFELEPVELRQHQTYGFRLQSENALIGLGEAVSHAKSPFPFGLSWNSDSEQGKGKFFNYFSLAFKVECCA